MTDPCREAFEEYYRKRYALKAQTGFPTFEWDAFYAAWTADRWIPVEQPPKESEPVMLTGFCFGDPTKGRWYQDARLFDGAWFNREGDELTWPTHWQPIAPPTTEAKL